MSEAFIVRRGGGSDNIKIVKNSTAKFNRNGSLATLRSSRMAFSECKVNDSTPEIGDLFICDGDYEGIILFFGENKSKTTGAAYLINTTADTIITSGADIYTGTLYKGVDFPAFYTAS